jgi:site-specific recombinase XerD
MVALTILDSLRASEVTGLKYESLNTEGLFSGVKGKGGKERLVPFSSELRKLLFKFTHRSVNNPANYICETKNRTRVTVRNLERDSKILGQRIGITGIRFSPHTLRHNFAVSYLT